MKNDNKQITKKEMNIKDFITLALPNIILISFILICVAGGVELEGVADGIFGDFLDILSDPIGIVLAVVFFPVAIILFLVLCVGAFFAVPVASIVDEFFLGDFLVWLAIAAGILVVFGAIRIRLGKWAEDNSYISGVRYEISLDSSGKGTAKQSNIYSGDDGILKNICLFLLRYIVVAIGGTVIFVLRIQRRYSN